MRSLQSLGDGLVVVIQPPPSVARPRRIHSFGTNRVTEAECRRRQPGSALCMRVNPGESLRGGPIEQDSPKTRTGCADEVPRGRRSERKQKTHTRKDGNPLIDGRGSWRRMRGRLDVVERELLRLSKSTSSDYSLILKGIQDRD